MKRLVLILVALFAAPVLANEHEEHVDPNAPVDKKKETADFILHHVADDTEFEMEIPFPPYHLPAVHIAEAFEFLKIEREPGACERPRAARASRASPRWACSSTAATTCGRPRPS